MRKRFHLLPRPKKIILFKGNQTVQGVNGVKIQALIIKENGREISREIKLRL